MHWKLRMSFFSGKQQKYRGARVHGDHLYVAHIQDIVARDGRRIVLRSYGDYDFPPWPFYARVVHDFEQTFGRLVNAL
jgi:hypothetical protein